MLPVLWSGGGSLNGSQSELLSRLIKELPLPLLATLVATFTLGEGGHPSGWTNAQLAVIQGALSRRPELDGETIDALVQQADANIDGMAKSLKFSNLLFTLVKSYSAELLPQLPLVRRTVEKLETFLRKSALAVIERLEAKRDA